MQYATVQELKAYPTGVNFSKTTDAGLDLLLQAASEYVDQETGHGTGAFLASGSSTRLFDGNGKDVLILPFAVSISAVSVDSLALTADRWTTYTYGGGPIYAIATMLPGATFSKGRKNISVTAVWGYSSTVPPGIRQAAILTAASYIKEQGAQAMRISGVGGAPSGFTSGRAKIDTTVNDILRNFRRPIP